MNKAVHYIAGQQTTTVHLPPALAWITDQDLTSTRDLQENRQTVCAGHGVVVGQGHSLGGTRLQISFLWGDGKQLVVHHLHLWNETKSRVKLLHTKQNLKQGFSFLGVGVGWVYVSETLLCQQSSRHFRHSTNHNQRSAIFSFIII